MKNQPFLPCLIAVTFVAAPAFAQNLLFYDRFDSTANAAPESPWNVANVPEAGMIEVRQDTESRFGRGTGNNYLYWASNDESTSLRIDNLNYFAVGEGPAVFTISFEFIETTDPFASNPRNNRFALRAYAGTGFNDQLQQIDFRDLRLTDGTHSGEGYAHDTLTRFDYVFNTTGDSIQYTGPDGLVDLAGGESNIWLDGAMIGNGRTITNAGPLTGFDLRNFSNNPGATFLIDDFGVFDGAVVGAPIPEPGTYALLFGSGAMVVVLLMRRRSRAAHQRQG